VRKGKWEERQQRRNAFIIDYVQVNELETGTHTHTSPAHNTKVAPFIFCVLKLQRLSFSEIFLLFLFFFRLFGCEAKQL
jgi:hypothetical protein